MLVISLFKMGVIAKYLKKQVFEKLEKTLMCSSSVRSDNFTGRKLCKSAEDMTIKFRKFAL